MNNTLDEEKKQQFGKKCNVTVSNGQRPIESSQIEM